MALRLSALLLPSFVSAGFDGWANVQGANYVPSYAYKDVHDQFVPGKWNASVVDRELGYAKTLAINSLRVFVTYGGSLDGGRPDVFIQNYIEFQHMMREHNLSMLVTMAGHSNDCENATDFINRVVEAEVPGVVIGYEADNEPAPSRIDYVLSCLLPALLAANRNPSVDSSIGFAHIGQAEGLHQNVTSLNWHSYTGEGNGHGLHAEIKRLQKISNMYTPPKPIVLTEWLARPAQPLAGAYPLIREAGVAAYLWALLIVDSRVHWDRPVAEGDPPFQGMLWPNGTAYDDLEEGECMREQCRTIKYVHHCCNNMDPAEDALLEFSGSDWEQKTYGSPVFNHAWGPREGSLRQTNVSGASVSIKVLEGSRRVALYLPTTPTGGAYTVRLDGQQVLIGSSSGPKLWENRVLVPTPAGSRTLEIVVVDSGSFNFMFSGVSFFTEAPPPTPPPAPTPPIPPSPPPQCHSDAWQTDVIIGNGQIGTVEKAAGASDCCLRCEAMAECACWTFKTSEDQYSPLDCMLKSSDGCAAGTTSRAHRISATMATGRSVSV